MNFELIHQSKKSRARVGRIHTPHGIIDTPNFVAVGTNGTLKAIDNQMIEAPVCARMVRAAFAPTSLLESYNGHGKATAPRQAPGLRFLLASAGRQHACATDSIEIQLMFCNTYHLMLQPGSELIKQAGGLHKFINRTMPIITDSGGFQVFSLMYGGVHSELKSNGTKTHDNSVLKINEDGVLFRSYRDGAKVLLTPETSIQAQKNIGADMIVCFDELPPYHTSPAELKKSLERTHRWEKRSLDEHLKNKNDQGLYAVIHGGLDQALRRQSCEYLSSLDFDGYAIGGSFGKTREQMFEFLKFLMPILRTDKPNHLLGIGDLISIPAIIPLGIDTFDCSHPTKAARHGQLFTKNGTLRVLKSGNSTNFGPIEKDCLCYTCKNYSLAYLCHLFKAHELTAYTLATIHNLAHMVELMKDYRDKILNDQI